MGKLKELKDMMLDRYTQATPAELQNEFDNKREKDKDDVGIGWHLSLPYEDMKRSISFAIRFGVGDKAVRKLGDSWTLCMITKIVEIRIADKAEVEPPFSVQYEVMDLDGRKHQLYDCNLMSVEEAVHKMMVFYDVDKQFIGSIVREENNRK